MALQKDVVCPNFHSVTRRGLLKGAATAAAFQLPALQAQQTNTSKPGGNFVYIGTYTPNGLGIELFTQNPSDGSLSFVKAVAGLPNVPNPSSLDISPNGKYLYAINEISNFNGGTNGSVTSFSINRANGDLTLLNVVDSQGAGPAHVSVDPKGEFVFAANYGGGSVAVFRILSDGKLSNATDTKVDVDSINPQPPPATSAPPGSFALSGHEKPHAHQIEADPDGNFVLHTDLAQDRIYVWKLDRANGKLLGGAATPFVTVPPRDGPRHFDFHPNGKWMYSIQEEGDTIIFWRYDSKTGALTNIQQVSSLPHGFAGTNYTSEIQVSHDGNFVYGANRLHDTIAVFEVGDNGRLSWVSETATRGDYPRNFAFDPRGNFMYVGNQRSDHVTTFHVDKDSGRLSFTGQYTPVGSPSIIMFLK